MIFHNSNPDTTSTRCGRSTAEESLCIRNTPRRRWSWPSLKSSRFRGINLWYKLTETDDDCDCICLCNGFNFKMLVPGKLPLPEWIGNENELWIHNWDNYLLSSTTIDVRRRSSAWTKRNLVTSCPLESLRKCCFMPFHISCTCSQMVAATYLPGIQVCRGPFPHPLQVELHPDPLPTLLVCVLQEAESRARWQMSQPYMSMSLMWYIVCLFWLDWEFSCAQAKTCPIKTSTRYNT